MLLFLIALLARILKVKIRMYYSTVVPFHKEFLKNIFREIYLCEIYQNVQIKSGLKKLMISIENNYFINFLQTVDFTAKI